MDDLPTAEQGRRNRQTPLNRATLMVRFVDGGRGSMQMFKAAEYVEAAKA